MSLKDVGVGIFAGLLIAFIFLFTIYRSAALTTFSYPTTPTSPTPAISSPRTLEIPFLSLTAPIETVGNTVDGRMDTPKIFSDVGWYQYGPRPGDLGNSVIAGHYDDPKGPSIFYHLKDLSSGDQIKITTQNGQTLTFKVTRVQSFSDTDFPISLVFGPAYAHNLNLITCDGVYDTHDKNYSKRLVVFATQLL